jgi:ribosome maturation factor RimP
LAQGRIVESVFKLASPLAEELGYELVDVEYCKEGPHWVLRCSIDCETGVGINECQRFSEALERLLDSADPIPGSYLLEISSPGIERPLRKDGDFVRFAGKSVEIKLMQPLDGKKIYSGILSGVRQVENSNSLKVVIDNNGQVTEIPREMIAKANLTADILNPKRGAKNRNES